MDISVILCTWNNADRLRITLDAVAQCRIPEGLRWELVLVNNNSTDHTEAVADGFEGRLPLTRVFEPTPGLSHARNAGLRAASGTFVLFTDDDVRPFPAWIEAYWRSFQAHGDRYYLGGPIESEFEGEAPPAYLLRHCPFSIKGLDWGGEERPAALRERFVSANWGCRRDFAVHAGGFDARLGISAAATNAIGVGEESDLMRRLQEEGIMPWYVPDARLYHFVPEGKVDVAHIAERREAYGRYTVEVLGQPMRLPQLLLQLAGNYGKWQAARLLGKDERAHLLRYRLHRGQLRGVLARKRGAVLQSAAIGLPN